MEGRSGGALLLVGGIAGPCRSCPSCRHPGLENYGTPAARWPLPHQEVAAADAIDAFIVTPSRQGLARLRRQFERIIRTLSAAPALIKQLVAHPHTALKVTDFQMLLEFQTSAQICVLFWRCINLALHVLHVAARGFENIVISNFHILFFRFVFWKVRGTGETQHALAS